MEKSTMFRVYRYRVGFYGVFGNWHQMDFEREASANLFADHLERCGRGVAVHRVEIHTPTRPVERVSSNGLR